MINDVVLVSGYNKGIQLYIYMYLFFFKIFSQLGCYIILSRIVEVKKQINRDFPDGLVVKNQPCNSQDSGSTLIRELRCHMIRSN